MNGSPFYDEGTAPAKGMRKGVVLARRLVRRLLRPMLFRLDGELRALERRQDELERQVKAAMALGWDHVAMARRLAVLEDHVDELMSRGEPDAAADGARPSIRYHGPEGSRADEPRHVIAPQSKVS